MKLVNLSKLNSAGISYVTDKREKDMTHEYQERMARQILGERQFNTEIDSWLREVRANAYVEIKRSSLDKRTYKNKLIFCR